MTDYMKEAHDEVVAFAKSSQEQPPQKMVTAVNAFFRVIYPNEEKKVVENAVGWRTIAAQRLTIGLIRDLSTEELAKAEKALLSIAGIFAAVRWVGGEWRAYVARYGKCKTAEKVIDKQTVKDFKQGRLSMGELIAMIFPNGISEREKTNSEIRSKGWRG